jgi:hypothetical protein
MQKSLISRNLKKLIGHWSKRKTYWNDGHRKTGVAEA